MLGYALFVLLRHVRRFVNPGVHCVDVLCRQNGNTKITFILESRCFKWLFGSVRFCLAEIKCSAGIGVILYFGFYLVGNVLIFHVFNGAALFISVAEVATGYILVKGFLARRSALPRIWSGLL